MVYKAQETLYEQLCEELIKLIKNELEPQQKMLSEREICRDFQVSRTTVRKALQELEARGYIYRRHGKGTFVSNVWQEQQNLLEGYSFTEQMKQLGRIPKTIITQFEEQLANREIATALGIHVGEKVYCIHRTRLADEVVMMIEITYLPVHLFPQLSREQLEARPLYDLFLVEYNHHIIYADEEFSADIVTFEEAKLLQVPTGGACLRLKRHTFNHENHVVEYTLSVARSDRFHYKVRHWRQKSVQK